MNLKYEISSHFHVINIPTNIHVNVKIGNCVEIHYQVTQQKKWLTAVEFATITPILIHTEFILVSFLFFQILSLIHMMY